MYYTDTNNYILINSTTILVGNQLLYYYSTVELRIKVEQIIGYICQ